MGHGRRTAGQQGLYPAAGRLHRSDQLFAALAVPVSPARTGPKHMRKIELEPWQRTIVTIHADRFARGLFHSDGWRGINRVRAHLAEGDHWYEYPRYLFTNESADILRLCGEALDPARGGLAFLAAEFYFHSPARGGGAARRVRRSKVLRAAPGAWAWLGPSAPGRIARAWPGASHPRPGGPGQARAVMTTKTRRAELPAVTTWQAVRGFRGRDRGSGRP